MTDDQAGTIIKIFQNAGMTIELGAQFSVRGQIAQLLNGCGELIHQIDDSSPLLIEVDERIKALTNCPVNNLRRGGWYWVRKENLDGQYDDWTPAFWNSDIEKFYSAFFSGIPESAIIVGNELNHDV